jgi:GT2 family glycosyltransferase
VSVIVATRNRGNSIIATIKSILQNQYPFFELLIIDQSENDLTQKAIQPFLSDRRIRYFKTNTRGLGISHNLGVNLALNEIIALTDDDCTVSPNWISTIIEAFKINDRIGIVFGKVLSSKYNHKAGYIPVFERNEATLLQNIKSNLFLGLGIGASLALRKSVWLLVKGFDEMLGPGSPLGSLEDRDFAIRVLLAGYFVYYTPKVIVVHYGFRPNKLLPKQAFEDWLGFGANYAKYLKCGHWSITYYMVGQMWLGQAVKKLLFCLITERRIGYVTPVVSFWLGFLVGLFSKLDYTSLRFAEKQKIPRYLHANVSQFLNRFTLK